MVALRAESAEKVRVMFFPPHPPPPAHLRASFPPMNLGLNSDFSSASLASRGDSPARDRLLQWYTPILPFTRSQPSKLGPVPPPHGSRRIVDRKKPSREFFLEQARQLLSESPLAASHLSFPVPRRQKPSRKFKVRFRWNGTVRHAAHLCGTFNETRERVPLTKRARTSGKEIWECVMKLSVGKYRYRYIIDGEWRLDHSTLREFVDGVPVANMLIIEPSEPLGP